MTTTLSVGASSLWDIIPGGELVYHLHPGQARAWRSGRRFVFILAGTQGGKTSFGPLWLYREIQTRGPGDYLAVTSTYPLLRLKMLPEFLRLFRDTLRLGEAVSGRTTISPSGRRAGICRHTDHRAFES
jgi:hypothetical protein